MNEENIKKYAELMKELGLTGMEITEDGKTLRLERMPAPPAPQAPQTVYVPEGAPAQSTAPAPSQAAGTPVTSPMVGIFYAAPAENAEPYVTVGTSVKKGDTLWDIAKKYLGSGSRWKEIYNLSGLTSQTIYAGQKLKIPD